MFRKELGRAGESIPEVGIGTWNYHGGPELLRQGMEAGALFVDTADSYGTEEVVGKAVAGMRDRVFIATKVSPQHFRRADFRRAVEGSLRRLGVDTIDLLQLHEPNPAIPIEETLDAAVRLVEAGKVRFVGVSNFSVKQLKSAQRALGRRPIVSNQVRYNLVDRTIEKDLLPYCQANRITVIAYSPLARGLDRLADCDPEGVLQEICRQTGNSPAQIALNWCLCQGNVVVIPKGNSEEHILENCGASGWRLSTEHLSLLDLNIRYRRRGRLDALARRCIPKKLQPVASLVVKRLPRSLRRQVR